MAETSWWRRISTELARHRVVDMEMIFNILEILIMIATEHAFTLHPYYTEYFCSCRLSA